MRKLCLFVALLCFMSVPMIASASCPDLAGLWAGGQIGLTVPGSTDVNLTGPNFKGTASNLGFNTGVMAGATVGYDFTRYFGVALDYSWNGLPIPNQRTGRFLVSSMNAYQNTIAALAMFRYGLLANQDFPAGRVFPYIGVGPALVITTAGFSAGSQTSTNVGLVAESGVRFFVVPKVSVDAAFRYKMSKPAFETQGVSVDPGAINTYGFLTRVAYHF